MSGKSGLVAAFCGVFLASASFAYPSLPPEIFPTQETQTGGFVGLSLPLVAGARPSVVLGLRKVTVGSGGDVAGGEVRVSFDPFSFGHWQVRALALKGSVDGAGTLGGGWDFTSGTPFVSLGLSMPYLSGMADFGLDGAAPQFTLGLDSLAKAATPAPLVVYPTPTCPVNAPQFSQTVC